MPGKLRSKPVRTAVSHPKADRLAAVGVHRRRPFRRERRLDGAAGPVAHQPFVDPVVREELHGEGGVRLEAAGGGEDATGPLDRHLHGLVAVDDECLVERVVVVVTDVCLLRNGIKLRSFNQPLNTIGTCPIIYAEGYSAALRFFPMLSSGSVIIFIKGQSTLVF